MKHFKNNKINLKWFVLIAFIIAIIFSIPTVRAETNKDAASLNQQLIVLLKQLITLLMQQVETLQKQLAAQQPVPKNSEIPTPSTISSIQQISNKLEIISVNITPDTKSAKIEWQTTQPAESKVFVYTDNSSSKVFVSDKFSTTHSVNITGLESDINYSYNITALNEKGFIKNSGNFKTLSPPPYFVVEISSDKDAVRNNGNDYATLTIQTKFNNGQILPNKKVYIKEILQSSSDLSYLGKEYISDNNGIIVYKTNPTKSMCDLSILIVVTENGEKNYSKSIKITNIQPVSGWIMCP